MNIYFEEIKKKLANKIKIEHLEIVDNSNKHKSHKYFSFTKVSKNFLPPYLFVVSIEDLILLLGQVVMHFTPVQ